MPKETKEQELERLAAELQADIDAKVAQLKKDKDVKEVFVLRVGDKIGYLRKPNRKDLAMSRSLGEGDYIASQEVLMDALWLAGDEEIKTDDDYFLNALPHIEGMIEAKKVELKKS